MMAIWRWGKPDALLHHSDQGSQYTSELFQCQSASKVVLIDIIGIARHPRSYGQGVFVFDPLHYLVLIETKPNALDQAAPLQDWDLSEVFQHLRHLLQAYGQSRARVHPGSACRRNWQNVTSNDDIA
jgi:hypothetical protein